VKIETVKQQLILEYLSTEISLRKLAYKYGYDHNVIYKWVMAYQKANKKGKMNKSEAVIRKALPEPELVSTDVKWLQEELRLSQIRVLLLEATIDIADEKFGTSMRKKVGARQS
jgi:transposase-like protein